MDTYLNLNPLEEIKFQEEISTFIQPVKKSVMQITTSWMRQGIEQGIEREKALVIRQIKRKFGQLDSALERQILSLNIDDMELLGEELFGFSTVEDSVNFINHLET